MADYAASIISVLAISALSVMLSYKADDKFVKLASSIIVIYVCLVPLSKISAEDFELDGFWDVDTEAAGQEEYESAAREAFALGVRKLVFEKWGITEENIEVRVTGLDIKKMCAEKINIILYGKAGTVDTAAVKKYIEEAGLGACEAEYGIK